MSVVVCFVVSAACAAPAVAQPAVGGSIRGQVTDEQHAALPGVRVTATSPGAPTSAVAVTDAAGGYRLTDLTPGTYTIMAELDGFARWVREAVVVRAGLNVTLPIVLAVGAVAETIEVRGDPPLVESKTALQAINISGELQRELPLSSRRQWSSLLSIVPGVITSNIISQEPTYYLHGSNQDANLSMVDGADATRALQTSTLSINYSNEAFEDVQVITGGTDASTPLGTGLVVNALTRSGTNQIRGSGALVYQPSRWNDSNVIGGTSPTTTIVQADLAAGGPVSRDRVWAFGAFRHHDVKSDLTRTADQIAFLQTLVPAFQPFRTGNRANYYFVKPTFAVRGTHQGSVSYRRDVNPTDSASSTDAAVFARTRTGGDVLSGRLASVWRSNLTTTIAASANTSSGSNPLVRTDAPSRRVHAGTLISGGRVVGTGVLATLDNRPSYSEASDLKTTVSGDVVWLRRSGLGSHEIRGGVYLDRRRIDTQFHYPDGGFSVEDVVLRDPRNARAGTAPFHRQIFDREQVTLTQIDALNAAVYVQDAWRPSDRLTVTAGVRGDAVRQTDRIFDVSLQDSVDLSPSVGVNLALVRSHAATLRASYARRREVMVFASAGSSAVGFRDLYDANLDGVFESTLITPGSTARATDRQFDPDRHQPFAEDVNVGVRYQLPARTLVDVGVFQRRFRDGLTAVEQNGVYDRNVFVGYRNPTLNDISLITNNIWNWPVYRSIEVQASRQTTRTQLVVSYTRQWQHLAGTWLPNDPASFIQPSAFENHHGIGLGAGSTLTSESNSLSGSSMAQTGTGSPWQDHVVNAAGSAKLWGGWQTAMTYAYTSGAWSGPIVTRLAAFDPQFGPATVVLSNGRLASNPLATVIRFAGATRSDRQFTLGERHLIGLAIGQTSRLRGVSIRTMLQAFNLTNSDAGVQLNIGGNQTFSPNFGQPISRTAPRAMQASVRFEF